MFENILLSRMSSFSLYSIKIIRIINLVHNYSCIEYGKALKAAHEKIGCHVLPFKKSNRNLTIPISSAK